MRSTVCLLGLWMLLGLAFVACKKDVEPTADEASPAKPAPAQLPGLPASLPGSPASLPGSPASLPGSPASLAGSPASQAGSPASLAGFPASLAGFDDDVGMARFVAAVEKRVEVVIKRPKVNAALDELVTALGDEKAFAAAGEALFTGMGALPEVSVPGAQIVARLGQDARMVGFITKMMTDDPPKTPAQVEAAMSARVDAIFGGSAWDVGFDRAFNRFSAQPSVDAAFGRLGDAVADGLALDRRFERLVRERASDARFIARLVALNGGEVPVGDEVYDVLLAKILTPERLESFLVEIFSLEEIRASLPNALESLLESPQFKSRVAARVGVILSDPQFQVASVRAIVTLLIDELTAERVDATMKPIFDLPVVTREIVGFVDDVRSSDELRGILAKALEGVLASKAVEAAFDKTLLRLE